MRAIFKIAGIMLVTYFIVYLLGSTDIFSGRLGFLLLAAVSFAGYVLYKYVINPKNKNNAATATNKHLTENKKPKVYNANTWIYGSILVFVLVYLLREFLADLSFQFFLFTDNLLRISANIYPVVMWAMLGVLIGAACGSFVASKKFRLNPRLNLISLGILALVIYLLFKVNHPLAPQQILKEVMTT